MSAPFRVNYRENGLVELVCEHGVGHPSKVLTPHAGYYGTHGCDGCCSEPGFTKAEAEQQALDAVKVQRDAVVTVNGLITENRKLEKDRRRVLRVRQIIKCWNAACGPVSHYNDADYLRDIELVVGL